MSTLCPYCGKSFLNFSGRKEYCSDQCSQWAFFAKNPEYYREWRQKRKPFLTVECRYCGVEYQTYNKQKIFCSNACKIAHNNKERPTTKQEIRECPICHKIFRPMQKTGVGRTYCTPICRNKAMNQNRKSATTRKHWKQQKKKWDGNWLKALQRDDFTCQICGKIRQPGEQVHEKRYILEVHHKDGSGETKGKNHELSNLTTLCHFCHTEFHTKINLVQVNGEYFIKGRIFEILGIKEIKTLS